MLVSETRTPLGGRASRAVILPQFSLVGPTDAPVIVVLGGISANRHVTSSGRTEGWWDAVVGDGLAIDTARFRVLGLDFVESGPDEHGRPRRIVTTHEQAQALAATLRRIGVRRAHAVVGASYGGMVALAFAESFPNRLERLVVLSAAHESHAMTTALRSLQRRIVELGIDTGAVAEAMSIARGLAMTTYRSADEFAARFDTNPTSRTHNDASFDVECYLRRRGEQFASSMRPERFLALSLSADLHRVRPAAITTPCTLVAAEGDTVVRIEQMRALAAGVSAPAALLTIPTLVGHDAFLVETDRVSSILSATLARDTR